MKDSTTKTEKFVHIFVILKTQKNCMSRTRRREKTVLDYFIKFACHKVMPFGMLNGRIY